MLLLTTIVVVLGSTAVTPLSASGSSQQVESQQAAMADGVLNAAVANGSLKVAVLSWNNSTAQYHNVTDDGDYTAGGPPNEFGHLLNRTFDDRDIAFTVNVRYINGTDRPLSERIVTRPMVTMGRPSDTGVRAVAWVTLYDNNTLYAGNGTRTNVMLSNSTYFAPDIDEDGPIYNVVQVEVIVWRV